jgi:intracellular multiplication protein IcmO
MTARRTLGPDANVERVGADLYRETRTGFVQFRDFLKSSASGGVLAMAAIAMAAEPGTIDILFPASVLYGAWVLTRRVVLPLRLPKGAKRLDYNHPHPKGRRPRMAAGILYLGRDYKTGQELWISNEDGRQHVAVPGTTGAGKTVALVSLCANALSWGSGFIFVDGKADNRLYADVLALARMYGREDDVLALNFLVASGNKDSATFNPFAWGNADVIREILVSQIEANPNGGDKGGNHVFMARAVALLGALTPALVWMRDHKGVPIDIEGIRFATELQSIVSLAIGKKFRRRDPTTGAVTEIAVGDEMDEALLYPLRSYLGETGGYDNTLPYNKQKSDEPAKQHSFVVMHFSATFTQLAVSLGHIFKCEIGDIDMRDVVLNRRILVVNLPTLENSGETTASLGRLVVASLRNMMAQTLGADLEGDYAEIVENKPHLAPTPFPVVFDEVGYYVVPGMDKMLAMGRGLGFMFYLGFQEVAGLRQRIGDAMYSLLGNANLQILMRLQEGSETRKYVEQTAGDTHVTQASSFQANEFGVFRESMSADVR